jgi:hypothetical protein
LCESPVSQAGKGGFEDSAMRLSIELHPH